MYGSCAGESVLAEGLRHWKCVPDGAEVRGGMSRVIPVRSAQGAALMLKAIPPQSARLEMRGLRAFPLPPAFGASITSTISACCFWSASRPNR